MTKFTDGQPLTPNERGSYLANVANLEIARLSSDMDKAEDRAVMYQEAHLLASSQRGELAGKLQRAKEKTDLLFKENAGLNRYILTLVSSASLLRETISILRDRIGKYKGSKHSMQADNKDIQAEADKFKSFAQAEVKTLVGTLNNERAKVLDLKDESQRRANVIAKKEVEITYFKRWNANLEARVYKLKQDKQDKPRADALNFTALVQQDLRKAKDKITELSRKVIKLQVNLAGAANRHDTHYKNIRALEERVANQREEIAQMQGRIPLRVHATCVVCSGLAPCSRCGR